MLRDITLGQYYPADSVIHKLDPRVKLFATLIYIISLFCFKGIAALLAATAFLFAVIKTSKVPVQVHGKRIEGDHGVNAYHSIIQLVPDTGRTDRAVVDF